MSLPDQTATRPMTVQELRARLAEQPRVPLAHLPTPLDDCPRLSKALGGPRILVKRDDMTGLAFGGNKTRTLEYVFADIVASGADMVVAAPTRSRTGAGRSPPPRASSVSMFRWCWFTARKGRVCKATCCSTGCWAPTSRWSISPTWKC